MKDLSGFPGSLNRQEEDDRDCINRHNVYINGVMYSPVSNTNEKDMYSFLQVNSLYCKRSILKIYKILYVKNYFNAFIS